MFLFQISDSGKSLLSDMIYIEGKSQKDALLKYVKSNCPEIDLEKIEIKKMDRGYNRYFAVTKCKKSDTGYIKTGNKIFFECFLK